MTRFKEVCQLHNHSKFSMLDAIPSSEEWVGWCLESGTPALSVTDHGSAVSLFDTLRTKEFIERYNKKHGTNYPPESVSLIPGVELYVKLNAEDKSHYHITVWAVSNEGYSNLMKLSSIAFNDTVNYYGNVKARVTFDQIKQHRKGLKFGTSCIAGPIGKSFWDCDLRAAEERFLMYKELFGDDLYIEFHVGDITHNFNKKTGSFDPIPPDACTPDGNKQKAYNNFLMDMLDKYGGKPIPVTDAHFIEPEDKVIQDIMLKNGNNNGWYFYESYHQKKADEMFAALKIHLGDRLTEEKFEQWIENTYEVMNPAKSIDVKFDYHLSKIDIPEHIRSRIPDYDTQTYYFMMERISEHGRWNSDPIYVKRFKQELDVIMKNDTLNFIPYFLIYEDIGAFCRANNILQNIARGSAGGSLISYYLKIIHIDPIKACLPFERFLSHARIRAGSFPDIDADIGDRARPLVMKYLQDKFGLGFAQIATFNKMKTKNAIKDAMWAVYGRNRNDPEIRAVCETIPDSPQGVDELDFLYGYMDQEGNYNSGQLETNETLVNFFGTYTDIEKIVQKLIGTIRGWSRHASAFVISTLDLSATRVPTMVMQDKNIGSIIVTQYNATMVEKCGLVKADILGVKTLTAVSECIDLVKKRTGKDYLEETNGLALIYELPEDSEVYRDFYDKKTDSSFQFSTELIKGMVQEFHPTKRKHLADFTALARPGALDFQIELGGSKTNNVGLLFHNSQDILDGKEKNKVMPSESMSAAELYMKVKNGQRRPQLIHKDLELILGETYSVAIYQEQIMAILKEIGDFTGEEADMIRSAIAKKKKDIIQSTFTKLRDSALRRGWTADQTDQLCKMVEAFSRYSFNKSHSCAYAELGYITMYLKHHHPLEWWSSILNLNIDDEDKFRKYVSLLADQIESPSMAYPTSKFEIYGNKIIAPLSVIKGIGPAVVKEMCSKGPFKDVNDFISRVDHSKVNMGSISCLIKGRAADVFMDASVMSYVDRRKKFMEDYQQLRGTKTDFKPELYDTDSLSVFLLERESNQCFNKLLLEDPFVVDRILSKWPALQRTGKKSIPFYMLDIPVLGSIRMGEKLLKSGRQDEISMILLFESSTFTTGNSKKTGKPWARLNVQLSDGYTNIDCVSWDAQGSLRWPKNTLVYVRGQLKEGWKTPISITISEIERVE